MTGKKLTECQEKAFAVFKELLETKEKQKTHLTINGRGGTGKTFLTKSIYEYVKDLGLNIMLAAPTHAARRELTKATGIDANTIHSILKISPKTYEDQSIFEQSEVPDLSNCNVLICDEASMYDKKLFGILMGTISRHTLVVSMGDKKQFRPVSIENPDEFEKTSRFFTDDNFKQIELLENKRNKGALLDVCNDVREGKEIYQNFKDGTGVLKLDMGKFMEAYFKMVKTPEDFLTNRMVAYTNKTVDTMNAIIRKRIYNTEEPCIIGEVIVLQEPVVKKTRFEGKNLTETVYNNGENVIIETIQRVNKPITVRGINETLKLDYYALGVKSLDTGICHAINVIYDEKEQNKLFSFTSMMAHEYKSDSNKRRFWPDYWSLIGDFIKVKPIPVSTIHKSQGSTYDNLFYIRSGLQYCDDDFVEQADYVAISRAKKFAIVLN